MHALVLNTPGRMSRSLLNENLPESLSFVFLFSFFFFDFTVSSSVRFASIPLTKD
jgi:hypothetical protein